MPKRVFFLFLVLWILAAPVLAVDNTIGVIQQDLTFVGLSVGDPSSIQYRSFDGKVVEKLKQSTSNVSLVGKDIYFYFDWPEIADEMTVSCDLGLSTAMSGPVTDGWYGYNRTGWNAGELVYLNATSNSFMGSSFFARMRGYTLWTTIVSNDSYQYLVYKMHFTASSGSLYTSQTFTESASISGNINNTFYLDQAYFYPPTYKIKATVNLTDSTSQPLFQLYDSYDTIYAYSSGVEFGSVDGEISTDDYGQMMGTVYGSSTASLSESGTLTASAASDVMAYGLARATFGNDGGLVDEVFDQGETLDQIAGDMSQIVEDMQAKQDTANDIGGATSEEQISGTQETISTGTAALDTFSNSAVSGLTDVSAQMQGYSALLAATVPSMLAFGEGDPLYWQLIGSISLAAIVIIARGLLRR